MVCVVNDLYQWVESTMFDEFDIVKSNKIIRRFQATDISYNKALDLLSKIDPHIYSYCASVIPGGANQVLTSGVFCKCSGAHRDGGAVDPNPVAGGIGLSYEEEYTKCVDTITSVLTSGADFYFTKSGKSIDCIYDTPELHDTFCSLSLTGQLATACGD